MQFVKMHVIKRLIIKFTRPIVIVLLSMLLMFMLIVIMHVLMPVIIRITRPMVIMLVIMVVIIITLHVFDVCYYANHYYCYEVYCYYHVMRLIFIFRNVVTLANRPHIIVTRHVIIMLSPMSLIIITRIGIMRFILRRMSIFYDAYD